MISREQMFEPMLSVCLSFIPAWTEFCVEWEREAGAPPLYLALGSLAQHLIERLQIGETEEFPAIFQVIERWHCEGDHYVQEAATIGLLEGIQNIASHEGVDSGLFKRWLLPESQKWWDRLDRFWDGDVCALRED